MLSHTITQSVEKWLVRLFNWRNILHVLFYVLIIMCYFLCNIEGKVGMNTGLTFHRIWPGWWWGIKNYLKTSIQLGYIFSTHSNDSPVPTLQILHISRFSIVTAEHHLNGDKIWLGITCHGG